MGNEFDSTKAPRNLSARQINYSLYSFFISILSKAIAKIRNNSLLAQKHFIKLPYFTTVMTPRIRDKLHVVPSLLHVQGTIKHRHLFDRYSIVFHSFSVSEREK